MSIKRNTALTLATQIAVIFLGMLNGIIVSRHLGPDLRGSFFMVITIKVFLLGLLDIGFSYACTRWVAREQSPLAVVHTNLLVYCALVTLLLFTIYLPLQGIVADHLLKNLDRRYILIGLLMVPFSLFYHGSCSMFVGLNRVPLLNLLNLITTAVDLAVVLGCFFMFDLGLDGLVAALLGANVLYALAIHLLLRRQSPIQFQFDRTVFRDMLKFGSVLYVGNAAQRITSRLDMFFVSYLTGSQGVGFYSLALNLAEMLRLFPDSVGAAAMPRIIGADEKESWSLASILGRMTTVVMALGAACGVAIAAWAIPLLYGNEFVAAVWPFQIMVVGMIFSGLSMTSVSHYVVGNRGKPSFATYTGWLTLLFNIPVCFLLTKAHGFVGTAWATASTYLFAYVLQLAGVLLLFRKPVMDLVLPRWSDLAIVKSEVRLALNRWLVKKPPEIEMGE